MPLWTVYPGVSDPASYSAALTLTDHKMNLESPTLLLILLHPHLFCQSTNHFLHCLLFIHNCSVFVFQPNTATVKTLPYSNKSFMRKLMLKYFPSFSLQILAFDREGKNFKKRDERRKKTTLLLGSRTLHN